MRRAEKRAVRAKLRAEIDKQRGLEIAASTEVAREKARAARIKAQYEHDRIRIRRAVARDRR
jgi:hypothetical protein